LLEHIAGFAGKVRRRAREVAPGLTEYIEDDGFALPQLAGREPTGGQRIGLHRLLVGAADRALGLRARSEGGTDILGRLAGKVAAAGDSSFQHRRAHAADSATNGTAGQRTADTLRKAAPSASPRKAGSGIATAPATWPPP
jgi:hypothetical protein